MIYEVVKSIALYEHEISINITNSYVENDADCNATGSHFEHHCNAWHKYLKWVEKGRIQPLRTLKYCTERMPDAGWSS